MFGQATRLEDIRHFERHLWRNGTVVRKFFFHVSRREQRERLLERFDDPEKNWKFSTRDVRERENWAKYTAAYREALAATSTTYAPWDVVPADHKWFARLLVAEIIIRTLDRMELKAAVMSLEEKRHSLRSDGRSRDQRGLLARSCDIRCHGVRFGACFPFAAAAAFSAARAPARMLVSA